MAESEESAPLGAVGASGTAGEENGLPAAPAGFWIRAGSLTIDGLVILTGIVLVNSFLALLGAPGALLQAIGLVFPFAYHAVLIGRFGKTAGKSLAGIAVVRQDGGRLGYPRAVGRALAYLASAATALIGYAAAAFTPQNRALHDYLAGTRVIHSGDAPAWRKNSCTALGVIGVIGLAAVMASAPYANRGGMGFATFEEETSRLNLRTIRIALLRRALDAGAAGREPYPQTLAQLAPEYLLELPPLDFGRHPANAEVEPYPADLCRMGPAGPELDGSKLKDTGRWGYLRGGADACKALVFIDCTHADSNVQEWFKY
ncbi:MAG: RDD family protein [Elusimicrobia bacterium]|nr:RDD family protein [Elusimicrobiota bacterium]